MKWESIITLNDKGLKEVLTAHIMANPKDFGVDLKTDRIKDITFTIGDDPKDDSYSFGGRTRQILKDVKITVERDTENQ